MTGGRVFIADDHPVTREGLSLAVRAALPGVAIVSGATVADAVAALATRPAFRLILLDLSLPDSHGYSGLLTLRQLDPSAPIVIVAAREDAALVEAARVLGAAGYLFKRLPLDDIAAALRRIAAGDVHFPTAALSSPTILAARDRIAGLSPAQHSVLTALADGRPNKQIARDLHITEATVKAHMTAIFRKMGVANRSQALLAVQPLFQASDADADAGA